MTSKTLGCAPIAFLGLSIGLLPFACFSPPPPVDPAVLKLEEERLLRPFVEQQVLAATEFEVRMTANFHDEFFFTPRSHTHKTKREGRADGGAVHTYYDTSPNVAPMRFKLGNTTMVVFEQLRLEVLGGTSELTLVAKGKDVTLHRGEQKQKLGTVEIKDGAFRRSR